jgi:hypothetical protein
MQVEITEVVAEAEMVVVVEVSLHLIVQEAMTTEEKVVVQKVAQTAIETIDQAVQEVTDLQVVATEHQEKTNTIHI